MYFQKSTAYKLNITKTECSLRYKNYSLKKYTKKMCEKCQKNRRKYKQLIKLKSKINTTYKGNKILLVFANYI